ncbi:proton-coupled folate transporter-like isoform X2 [Branchiostoma floridae]|uniref:Proton-coupled folate transporter-like isoform X1 n=1 Tax=Branchiostoma floridae TaxID=7739 RepID=A0A9J7MBK9_BRAFL|nr:proton-coupled folate transporter-like isoform X1 [Branchiostoma floridae]XP_035697909.1 proton-coupled folate transporter-like isoform X2 [Branchiostoma floridae]
MSVRQNTRVKPWCPVTVEPLLIVGFIGLVASSPTYYQYIYNFLGNGTLPTNTNTSSCDSNVSDPAYQRQLKTQAETSQWQLYLTLALAIPGALSTIALGTLSDTFGRKVALLVPLVGGLLSAVAGAVIINFSFPLEVMIAGNFVYGLSGSWTALFGGCFAYIADITDPGRQRTFRVALLESGVGISSLVGEIGTGYWIRGGGIPQGFQQVSWGIVGCSVFCLLYLFTLKETRPAVKKDTVISCSHFRRCFNAFYEKRYEGRRRKLLLGTLAYLLVIGCGSASNSLITIYVLGAPFCFTSDLIGLMKAALGSTFLFSLLVIRVCNSCMSEFAMLIVAFVSLIAGQTLLAFAGDFGNPEIAVFMVPVLMMLRAIIPPVMKVILSRDVLPSEQGIIFAVLASTDSVGHVIFSLLFNNIYSSTVGFMPGFVFLLAAGIAVIAAAVIGIMQYYEPNKDYKPLSLPEDPDDPGKNAVNT